MDEANRMGDGRPGEPVPPGSLGSRGHGWSDDKSVQVTIAENGLVERVEIDPRTMRRGSEALAELTRDAMRNAQEDWFRGLAEAMAPEQAERARAAKERLRQRLDEIDARYTQRMQDLHGLLDRISNQQ
jgi:YbaB/EbfC DNA-binding family protein